MGWLQGEMTPSSQGRCWELAGTGARERGEWGSVSTGGPGLQACVRHGAARCHLQALIWEGRSPWSSCPQALGLQGEARPPQLEIP